MTLTEIILYVAVPGIGSLITYVLRGVMLRIETLEQKIENTITEEQVRLVIKDKVSPLEDKLDDIQEMVSKLLDIQLNKRN